MLNCRTEVDAEALKALKKVTLYRSRNAKIALATGTGVMTLDLAAIARNMQSGTIMVLSVLCAVAFIVTIMSLSGMIFDIRTRTADRQLTSGYRVYHIDETGIGYESQVGTGHDDWSAYREWGRCGHYFWLKNIAHQFVLIDAGNLRGDEPERLRMLLEDKLGRGLMIMGFREKLAALAGRGRKYDWFAVGVACSFKCDRENAADVSGDLRGTLRAGDDVRVSIMHDDRETEVLTAFVTEIKSLDGKKTLKEATDQRISFTLAGISPDRIVSGAVIHSRNVSQETVWDQHCRGLSDNCILVRRMNLDSGTVRQMSVSDCCQVWFMFRQYIKEVEPEETEQDAEENRQKVSVLVDAITARLFNLDYIYCLFSNMTGEPAMFSRTLLSNGNYNVTPPDIWIFTEPHFRQMSGSYPADRFEMKRIENGPEGEGIRHFLEECVLLNGACGIRINCSDTVLDQSVLVESPDYTGVPEEKVTVTNPDVERWILMLGQMGRPETDDEQTVCSLYFTFMAKAMAGARLLVPVTGQETFNVDENGMLKKDATLGLPTMKGKTEEREAVRMYTDWKRLRAGMGEGSWNGLVQTVGAMIDVFDCAVNVTENTAAGCYIDREMFSDIIKIAEGR
ncbi:hypothetical protein [Ligilactobacillus sp.]|uniref:hypothetical protein n=1 Tax=Ligilactobacillus sp. TaxID=2767921 RepID=UPI002FDFFB6C